MQMNYRCPGCNATMDYYPSVRKMYCVYCDTTYSVEELREMEEKKNPDAQAAQSDLMTDPQFEEEKKEQRKHATIKMQILHCNSCGAELAMNGVEVSSFCAYCGQATVVLDRVEECLEPDNVIPFIISKTEAESIIRKKLSQGSYIPDDIKNFEIERLRGIYIPFWLYDVYYGDDQWWSYHVRNGVGNEVQYSHRIAECHYGNLTLDASKILNDISSRRLEPYYMEDLKDFDPMYLSGFYADRFDVGLEETDQIAIDRAKHLYDEAVKNSIPHKNAQIDKSHSNYKILDRKYGLFPVWFLTFRNEGFSYTIMVNGQTGKVVGAVPYDKDKVYRRFLIRVVLLGAVLVPINAFIGNGVLSGHLFYRGSIYFGGLAIAIVVLWKKAIDKYKSLENSVWLTRSGRTSRFVKERQEK